MSNPETDPDLPPVDAPEPVAPLGGLPPQPGPPPAPAPLPPLPTPLPPLPTRPSGPTSIGAGPRNEARIFQDPSGGNPLATNQAPTDPWAASMPTDLSAPIGVELPGVELSEARPPGTGLPESGVSGLGLPTVSPPSVSPPFSGLPAYAAPSNSSQPGSFGGPPIRFSPPPPSPGGPQIPLAAPKKKRRVWLIVLCIILALAVAAGGFFWWVISYTEGVTHKAELAVPDDATIGSCWNEVDGSSSKVPCNTPHDFEVFEQLYYFAGPYPDLYFSAEPCQEQFEPYIGSSFWSSDYDYTLVRPSEQSWDNGNQIGFCVLYLEFQGRASSTARNSGR